MSLRVRHSGLRLFPSLPALPLGPAATKAWYECLLNQGDVNYVFNQPIRVSAVPQHLKSVFGLVFDYPCRM